MIQRNKKFFNTLSIISTVSIALFSLKDNLLSSNLSRIANATREGYFYFLLICLIYGLVMFLTLRRIGLGKLSYVGLISLLIGGIVPYNYKNSNSLSSNLHLIGGLLSIILILICLIYSISKFSTKNIKLAKIFIYGLIIVSMITVYLMSKYGFMNSLNELIYLEYSIVIMTTIFNV